MSEPQTSMHQRILGDIERRTWSANHVVTSVRLPYPADRHRLTVRFAPSHH